MSVRSGVQPREDEQIGIFARIFARIFVSSFIQFPHPSKIAEERWTLCNIICPRSLLPCAEALNRGPGWRSPPWNVLSSAASLAASVCSAPPARQTSCCLPQAALVPPQLPSSTAHAPMPHTMLHPMRPSSMPLPSGGSRTSLRAAPLELPHVNSIAASLRHTAPLPECDVHSTGLDAAAMHAGPYVVLPRQHSLPERLPKAHSTLLELLRHLLRSGVAPWIGRALLESVTYLEIRKDTTPSLHPVFTHP